MNIKKLRFIYNSISFKIILYIIIILTPLISLLIYNNYKSRESLLRQVENVHKNMLQSYIYQIDSQLKSAMSYTLDMALFQDDPKILINEHDESDIAIVKYRIFANLSNRLISNNLIDAFFLYVKSGNYFVIASQAAISSNELDELKRYLLSDSQLLSSANSLPKSNWFFTNIANNNALINMSYNKGDVIAGAYVNTDSLLNKYIRKNAINLEMLFVPSDSIYLENSNISRDTVFIACDSSVASISLAEYLPKADILNSLPFIHKYILLISIILILTIPVLILLMKLTVVNPLQRLNKAMVRIRLGDLTHRIKLQRSSNEFEIVNEIFNEMMDTVQNLKINVYEEQIKVQKSQLRNLQLQIKPHFLINSLNMVNNLIYNKDLTTAKDLILHSVDYFRYMSKADNDFVLLNEEVRHITNYLEIQKIRYVDKFTYSIDINQLIEDMLIPPMLIQNFIENSIKYAIEMSSLIHISIKVEYFEVDYYPYAKIIISDTGVGYPSNILDRLNSGRKIKDSLGEHIGIYNSVQRIKILYDGKGSWKFYNDGGAVSEFTLPALFQNDDEDA